MSSNIKISRICQLCGNEFTARTTVTQYCGDVCAKRAYKKKQKVQKIEQSNIETLAIKAAPIKAIQEQDYLSIQETCELLRISRMTLYRLIKHKKIHSVKFGRRTIISSYNIDQIFISNYESYSSAEKNFKKSL
jgi:excisionase family DNA binding protein